MTKPLLRFTFNGAWTCDEVKVVDQSLRSYSIWRWTVHWEQRSFWLHFFLWRFNLQFPFLQHLAISRLQLLCQLNCRFQYLIMCFVSTSGKYMKILEFCWPNLGNNWIVDMYGKPCERIIQIHSLVPCSESLQARQLLVCPIDPDLCHMSPTSVNLAHWGARKSLPRWMQPSNRSPYLFWKKTQTAYDRAKLKKQFTCTWTEGLFRKRLHYLKAWKLADYQ